MWAWRASQQAACLLGHLRHCLSAGLCWSYCPHSPQSRGLVSQIMLSSPILPLVSDFITASENKL